MLRFLKRLFKPSRPAPSSFGRTDTGMVRKNNEDNFAILMDRGIFLVADGMGGHNAGDVASRVATEALIDFFSEEKIQAIKGKPLAVEHAMLAGFRQANERVMALAEKEEGLSGMGCTLIACLVDGESAYFCHVGDVRGYVEENGRFVQITRDHSLVADQKTSGLAGTRGISRNIVTRGIGFPFSEDAEFHRYLLHEGDRILLCTDGLWGMVDDEEIHAILKEAETPEEACDELVSQANRAGGKDNITAVAVYC